MRIIKKLFTFLTVILFLVALFYAHKGVNRFLHSKYFDVKKVNLVGVVNSDVKNLDKICKNFIGKNIFGIDKELLESKEIDDIWIEKIEIKKHYPSEVNFYVYEKKVLYYFNRNNQTYSYLSDGSIIRADHTTNIYVYGKYFEDSLKSFVGFSKNPLIQKADKVILNDSHIKINIDDMFIKSGYDIASFNKSLRYFENIKKRYKKINYVDLRLNGKIYINGVRL
jgi:cell division protein FtsQ